MPQSSFNLFEDLQVSDSEIKIASKKSQAKLAAAIYDVQEKYGEFLNGATALDEFHDRVALCKPEMMKTVDQHLMPVTGIMRRVVKACKDEWRLRTACTCDDMPKGEKCPSCKKKEASLHQAETYSGSGDVEKKSGPFAGEGGKFPIGTHKDLVDAKSVCNFPSVKSKNPGACSTVEKKEASQTKEAVEEYDPWDFMHQNYGETTHGGGGSTIFEHGPISNAMPGTPPPAAPQAAPIAGPAARAASVKTAGTDVEVSEIPECDICKYDHGKGGVPAAVDGATKMGPWANMCEDHFRQHGVGLGTGRGQRLHKRQGSFEKGAPFAGYKDFAACESANQDKGDTGAYCGSIMHKVEEGRKRKHEKQCGTGRTADKTGPAMDNDVTFKPSEGELKPEGDFKGYLKSVDQGAEEKVSDRFEGGWDPHEHTGDPAKTDFTKDSSRRLADGPGPAGSGGVLITPGNPPTTTPAPGGLPASAQPPAGSTWQSGGGGSVTWTGKEGALHGYYRDWCARNGLKVASFASLDYYAQNLSDGDYFTIFSAIREAAPLPGPGGGPGPTPNGDGVPGQQSTTSVPGQQSNTGMPAPAPTGGAPGAAPIPSGAGGAAVNAPYTGGGVVRGASRRVAQGKNTDYLGKADEALTNLLNQKAEEFQESVSTLQQALQIVQQAEQQQAAMNPMAVQPPAGSVNVLPGADQGGGGAPGGGMPPQMGGGGGGLPPQMAAKRYKLDKPGGLGKGGRNADEPTMHDEPKDWHRPGARPRGEGGKWATRRQAAPPAGGPVPAAPPANPGAAGAAPMSSGEHGTDPDIHWGLLNQMYNGGHGGPWSAAGNQAITSKRGGRPKGKRSAGKGR